MARENAKTVRNRGKEIELGIEVGMKKDLILSFGGLCSKITMRGTPQGFEDTSHTNEPSIMSSPPAQLFSEGGLPHATTAQVHSVVLSNRGTALGRQNAQPGLQQPGAQHRLRHWQESLEHS